MSFIIHIKQSSIYLGTLKDAKSLQYPFVINCTPESVQKSELQFPIEDDPKVEISQYFESAYQYTLEAINKSLNIIVCCKFGVSRSATILIAILMRLSNSPLDTIYQLVIEQRPQIDPNPGFAQQLLEYELKVQKNIKQNEFADIILQNIKLFTYHCKKCNNLLFKSDNLIHGQQSKCMFYLINIDLSKGCSICSQNLARLSSKKCTCSKQVDSVSEVFKYMIKRSIQKQQQQKNNMIDKEQIQN